MAVEDELITTTSSTYTKRKMLTSCNCNMKIEVSGYEAKSNEHTDEASMPCARGLFKTIDSHIKITQIMWIPGILKARRLVHVYFFL